MGNIKEQSFEEIWSGPQSEAIRARVDACEQSCAFIGTARFDMLRHPTRPLSWIAGNKLRLKRGLSLEV